MPHHRSTGSCPDRSGRFLTGSAIARAALAVAMVAGLFASLLVPPASAIPQPASISDADWNATWDPAAGWPPPGAGWPEPIDSPQLAASCGIDLAVLVDRSGSIVGAGQAANYQSAVKDLVDAFAGSPSTMGVWSFGDHGSDFDPALYPSHPMVALDGPDGPNNVADLKATVDGIPFVRNQSTNWEEGLEAVVNGPVAAAGTPDLLLVITDGEPTIHRDDPDTGDTINNDDVAGGIESANAVKASGTRVLAVGVGPSVTEEGLAQISGDTPFSGANIATADFLTTSFADLRSSLLAFATAICGGSVTVTKEASTPAAPAAFAPASGWTIRGVMDTPPPSGATVSPGQPGTPAADDGLTGADGRVSFGWSSVDSERITITETPQPGFTLVDRTCTRNGSAFPFTEVADGIQLDVGPLEHVECTLRNSADAVDGVDLTVTKTDGITTARPGDTVSYTIDYRNDGTAVATGVELQETVPLHATFDAAASSPLWDCNGAAAGNGDGAAAGTSCTAVIGDVAPSTTFETVVFAVTVDDVLPAGVTQLTNTVVIAGDNENDDQLTNTSTDEDTLDAAPDLAVVKDDGGVVAAPGDAVTYTLRYSNGGTQDATGVVLTETVPPGSTFVGPADWVCTGDTCVAQVGDLAVGQSGSIDFTVRIDDPLPDDQTAIDNVVVAGDDGLNGDDLDLSDNTARDSTEVGTEVQVLGEVIERPLGELISGEGIAGELVEEEASRVLDVDRVRDTTVRSQAGRRQLARTGSNAGDMVVLAVSLMAAGVLLLLVGPMLEQRRRRGRPRHAVR